MGLEKAKSLLTVKDGKTFLDLIADQIKYTRQHSGSKVRFVLMNSFSTSADTKARSAHPCLSPHRHDTVHEGDHHALGDDKESP